MPVYVLTDFVYDVTAAGWRGLPVQRENGGREQRWFYFYPNGKKAADTSITESDENGRYRYTFDENGMMRSSKKLGSSPNTLTEQWIERVPKASQDSYASENHIKRWYYGLSDGTVVQNRMRNIGGRSICSTRQELCGLAWWL